MISHGRHVSEKPASFRHACRIVVRGPSTERLSERHQHLHPDCCAFVEKVKLLRGVEFV
jgi:hypothetical protein